MTFSTSKTKLKSHKAVFLTLLVSGKGFVLSNFRSIPLERLLNLNSKG